MIYQLPEIFQVETPLGHGYAIMVETTAHDQLWTVAIDNGALVTFPQDKIRMGKSYTHGRRLGDPEMKKILEKALK